MSISIIASPPWTPAVSQRSCVARQDVIELDRDDEQSGRMQEIHQHLQDAYSQTPPGAEGSSRSGGQVPIELILEDPAQEASESSQELCDTVQEVSEAHEHSIEDAAGKAHCV